MYAAVDWYVHCQSPVLISLKKDLRMLNIYHLEIFFLSTQSKLPPKTPVKLVLNLDRTWSEANVPDREKSN